MAKNKNQHFVPAFYLKNFSNNGKTVGLYNFKNKIKIDCAAIKDQTSEDYFYGDDLVIERFLSMIEGGASPIIREILKTNTLPKRNSEERIILLCFIITLHGRTKKQVDARNNMNDMALKKFLKTKFEESGISKEMLKKIEITDSGCAQKNVVSSVETTAGAFDLSWKLIVSDCKSSFITSDHPVIFTNPLQYITLNQNTCGINSNGLILLLTLDQKRLLILFDRSSYKIGNERKPVERITEIDFVKKINRLQAQSAYENLFFNSTTEFNEIDLITPREGKFKLTNLRTISLNNLTSEETIGMSIVNPILFPIPKFISIRKSAKELLLNKNKSSQKQILFKRSLTDINANSIEIEKALSGLHGHKELLETIKEFHQRQGG